jgi:hypothetical protein
MDTVQVVLKTALFNWEDFNKQDIPKERGVLEKRRMGPTNKKLSRSD